MDILIGILAIVVGLSVCFSGIRLFFALLPLWGFIVGFMVGAGMMAALFDDHAFMATTTGIVVGLVVGVVFMALSYAFWYIGAILAAGAAGGLLGAGLFAAIGIDSSFLLFIGGLAGSVLFMLGALVLALPVYVVVVNTAIGGSAMILAGIAMVFNNYESEFFGTGLFWARIHNNFFLWVVFFVIAVAGIGAQLKLMAEAVTLPEDKWTKAQPGTPAAA